MCGRFKTKLINIFPICCRYRYSTHYINNRAQIKAKIRIESSVNFEFIIYDQRINCKGHRKSPYNIVGYHNHSNMMYLVTPSKNITKFTFNLYLAFPQKSPIEVGSVHNCTHWISREYLLRLLISRFGSCYYRL